MFCTNCGSQVKGGNVFCPVCGARMKSDNGIINADINQSGNKGSYSKPKMSMITIIMICEAGLIVFLAAVFILLSSAQNSAVTVETIDHNIANAVNMTALADCSSSEQPEKYADSDKIVEKYFEAVKAKDPQAFKEILWDKGIAEKYKKTIDQYISDAVNDLNSNGDIFSYFIIDGVEDYYKDKAGTRAREYNVYCEYFKKGYVYKSLVKLDLVYVNDEIWKVVPGKETVLITEK